MQTPVLSSTFFLTLLLLVGLFFFIRASTKARIEVAQLWADREQEQLLEQLQTYFTGRAYRLINIDAEQNQVTFEGFVRPSWFLAIFLSMLAAVGLLCLSLVLAFLMPDFSSLFLALLLLAPAAGIFYWKRSARLEQVSLQVAPLTAEDVTKQVNDVSAPPPPELPQTGLVVTGHRDELAELQRALNLKPLIS